MRTAVMQPYLFPYLGYFQLIRAVDAFVICDDVQYINKGWINRNKILVEQKEMMVTFSLKRDAYEKNINERYFSSEIRREKERFFKMLKSAYAKAPFYQPVSDLVDGAFCLGTANIAQEITDSLHKICDYLDIKTKFCLSSQIEQTPDLKRQDKVIDICKILQTTQYINAIGGTKLYDREVFLKNGIQLNFIAMKPLHYKQFNHPFVADLSIIDVMMFNSPAEIQAMLEEYSLI